ncbi:uncharacterized protein N7503_000724 [Penicillium pulvis]|uniref:uncharacterized protein n=1 Tax=Penicillium pulvis TaxID=1562058 RepID=UPI0025498643|nr:uncharacterized protein N7503_000724 [Penicillium pulvis]KAJ5813974.1 hypothetical protein N7503_000724 [Penicillium pulvis]
MHRRTTCLLQWSVCGLIDQPNQLWTVQYTVFSRYGRWRLCQWNMYQLPRRYTLLCRSRNMRKYHPVHSSRNLSLPRPLVLQGFFVRTVKPTKLLGD